MGKIISWSVGVPPAFFLFFLTLLTPLSFAAEKTPAAPAAPAPSVTPSRLLKPEEITAFIQSMETTASIRSRATDPFGLVQDPNTKPPPSVIASSARKNIPLTPVKSTPFPKIVQLLKITAIMPGQGFLIGNRSFQPGDTIPLVHKGRKLCIKVLSVSSSSIDFQNTENSEVASYRMNSLPAGMTQADANSPVPGMTSSQTPPPINLD